MGTSIYYQDPDHNIVEINVNNFGATWTATEYLRTATGALPAQIDLEKMLAARKTGASAWDLHQRAQAGEFSPESPLDPRQNF